MPIGRSIDKNQLDFYAHFNAIFMLVSLDGSGESEKLEHHRHMNTHFNCQPARCRLHCIVRANKVLGSIQKCGHWIRPRAATHCVEQLGATLAENKPDRDPRACAMDAEQMMLARQGATTNRACREPVGHATSLIPNLRTLISSSAVIIIPDICQNVTDTTPRFIVPHGAGLLSPGLF